MPADTPLVLTIPREDILQKFISDLRKASKKSKRAGGGYSVFLHGDGTALVEIQICYGLAPKKEPT